MDSLIDKLVRDEPLTEEESLRFQELQSDTSFINELDFRKSIVRAYRANHCQELKSHLQSLERSRKQPYPASLPRFKRLRAVAVMGIAASLLALVLFIYPGVLTQGSSSRDLFDTYYQDYPNIVAPTVKGVSSTSLLARGVQLFENKEYAASKDLLASIEYANDTVAFYQGLNFIQLDKLDDANHTLTLVVDHPNRFRKEAEWYLALLMLRTNDRATARSLLTEISHQNGHPYATKADAILQQL